jgi:hypothetical protein
MESTGVLTPVDIFLKLSVVRRIKWDHKMLKSKNGRGTVNSARVCQGESLFMFHITLLTIYNRMGRCKT